MNEAWDYEMNGRFLRCTRTIRDSHDLRFATLTTYDSRLSRLTIHDSTVSPASRLPTAL